MERHINKLIEIGVSTEYAVIMVLSISKDAYEAGYEEGKLDKPGIIGESLPESGKDFFQWWEEQLLNTNKQ